VAGIDRPAILAWCAAAGQHGFAGLARLVFDCAAADAVAAGLITQAVAELERLALALDPEADLPLALAGSIALRLAPNFSPALQARFVPAQGDSADGALQLIRQILGS
jgi:glucosamine kinase